MANNLIPEELNALIQQYREGQGPVPWPFGPFITTVFVMDYVEKVEFGDM